MTILRINFSDIPAADAERALKFYTGQLGFEPRLSGKGLRLGLKGSETSFGFVAQDRLPLERGGMPTLCLVSDDVDAECARLAEAGVTLETRPAPAPWAPGIRWAMIRDSEGNRVMLESKA